VIDAVDENTRVLIGHSLGSVVAYEALCANPTWSVVTLVTLGSPLGIPNLVFDRLQPTPRPASTANRDPRGHWPGGVRTWNNISDKADVVAIVKDLRPLFGDRVQGYVVDNGAHAHDVKPYLTAVQTGHAVLAGLQAKGQQGDPARR
jgi:pimeloyl-ACP methyl ester carboxylesterase